MSESQPKQDADKYSRRTVSALLHGIKLQGGGHVIIGGFKAIFKEELTSDHGFFSDDSYGVIFASLLGLSCHERMPTLSPG